MFFAAMVQLRELYINHAVIGSTQEAVDQQVIQIFRDNGISVTENAGLDEAMFNDVINRDDISVIFSTAITLV